MPTSLAYGFSLDLGNFSMPVEAVTETFGILAAKRAGKSNAAVAMAEEMFKNGLPWVAVDPKGDWWGIRSSADGKGPGLPVLVLGGLHGDVPLEPGAGRLVADLVVDQRMTCVLDVSEMSKSAQRQFLTDFVEQLYKRNREPLHVFCEEADEYIPQFVNKDTAKMVGAWETLVKRGGFRGIGITLITQRSASLNKDVLTQIQTLFALRTLSPQDRKAILGWVEQHALGPQMVARLPSLGDGQAVLFSPEWLKRLDVVQFRRRSTFDSGSTPKVGVKARPPVTLADVDIASLREKMAATIERANADDPGYLKRRIHMLEVQLRQANEAADLAETKIRTIEVLPEDLKPMILALTEVSGLIEAHAQLTNMVNGAVNMAGIARKWVSDHGDGKEVMPHTAGSTGTRRDKTVGVRRPAETPAFKVNAVKQDLGMAGEPGAVSRPQQKVLNSLAWLASIGISPATRAQAAFISRMKPSTGHFNNLLGGLRTAGYVDYPEPSRVTLTAAGKRLAEWPTDDPTEADLQERILSVLTAPQQRIVRAVIPLGSEGIARDQLAEKVNMLPGTGHFNNLLGSLRTLGLIDYPSRGRVRPTEVLYLV